MNTSCFPTSNPLVCSTTSEHSSKKMKATGELGLTHMDCSTEPVSHEQKLTQSLEMALMSTLGSMPSFTARLNRSPLQHLSTRGSGASGRPDAGSGQPACAPGPECTSCKRAFSPYFKKEPMYQLPCGHLLCRPCLGRSSAPSPPPAQPASSPLPARTCFGCTSE